MPKRLIYGSTASQRYSSDELLKLLNHARRNNSIHNVTGFLTYDGAEFMQLIEGPPKSIDKLYDNICKDSRHKDVQALIIEDEVPRIFSAWSMTYLYYDRNNAVKIGGSMASNGLRDLMKLVKNRDSMCVTLIVERLKDVIEKYGAE